MKTPNLVITAVLVGLSTSFVAGCQAINHQTIKSNADTGNTTTNDKTATTQANANLTNSIIDTSKLTTYQLDPHHTNVRFAINHMGTSTVTGGFYELTGEVKYSQKLAQGTLNISIPMSSLHTVSRQFTQHLLTSDFFDAKQYPTAEFQSTSWQFDTSGNDKGMVTSVEGELTLHGHTHPITLTATNFNCYLSPIAKAQVCGGDFTTQIDRTKWGISKYANLGVDKMVTLAIEVEAIK